MAERLASLKGKAVLSINDHPDIRRCFAAFQHEEAAITYTVGGGAAPATRRELIVYSWDRAAQPAGLF